MDQDAVEAVVGHHGLQAGQVMRGRAGGQHIHRVVYRGLGVEFFREQGFGFIGQRGQGQAGIHQDVGGDHRRPTGVGDDAHSVSFGNRL